MACLETDFLVALHRKDNEAMSFLEKLVRMGEPLSITPISLTELYFGAFKSVKQGSVMKVEEMAASLNLLNYDGYASREAGRLLDFLEKKGEKIGNLDTLTAAIAIRYNQKLITRNIKHFGKLKGLEIEKW